MLTAQVTRATTVTSLMITDNIVTSCSEKHWAHCVARLWTTAKGGNGS